MNRRQSPAVAASFSLALFLFATCTLQAQEWPRFRGPAGNGVATAKDVPVKWSETENVKWKTPIPGLGWSSPVISGDQIWMTTATVKLADPKDKENRLASNTGNQPLTVVNDLKMRAICVNRTTGELMHDVLLMTEPKPDPVHATNSFASPTPVLEDGRLYCYFGTNGAACLDTKTQEVLWTNRDLRINHENGPGSTPVLWGELMIFHCDGSDQQYVAALFKESGKLAWKARRSGKMNENPQLKKAYGTPIIVKIKGKEVLVSPGADWVYGYDPATGEELWKVSYGVLGFSLVPTPVAAHGRVYIFTSYLRSQLLALKYDGDGQPEIEWRVKKSAPAKPSPLVVGDELYMIHDRGVATCLDAKTGEEIWSKRISGNFSASPLYADGKIYFCSHEGVTTVIQAGREYKMLGRNELASDIKASPAAIGNALYIRTKDAMYRIEADK